MRARARARARIVSCAARHRACVLLTAVSVLSPRRADERQRTSNARMFRRTRWRARTNRTPHARRRRAPRVRARRRTSAAMRERFAEATSPRVRRRTRNATNATDDSERHDRDTRCRAVRSRLHPDTGVSSVDQRLGRVRRSADQVPTCDLNPWPSSLSLSGVGSWLRQRLGASRA